MSSDDILADIQRSLGRIEGQLGGMVSAHKELREAHDATEKRVDTLEARANWSYGWAVGAGAAGGGLLAFLKAKLGG